MAGSTVQGRERASASAKLRRRNTPNPGHYRLPALEFEHDVGGLRGDSWKHHTRRLAPERYPEDVSGGSRQTSVAASMPAAHVKSRVLKPWSAVSLSQD